MLELRNISITQGDFSLAADLSVPAASRVAVIGASGSGKSTFLSLIGGFLAPDSGQVLRDGRDLTAVQPGPRPARFLFQV